MDESCFKGTYVCFPNLTLTDLITDKVQLVRIVIFECPRNQLDMSLFLLYYLCNNDKKLVKITMYYCKITYLMTKVISSSHGVQKVGSSF